VNAPPLLMRVSFESHGRAAQGQPPFRSPIRSQTSCIRMMADVTLYPLATLAASRRTGAHLRAGTAGDPPPRHLCAGAAKFWQRFALGQAAFATQTARSPIT
jgi:hypothetical protein